MNDHVSTDEGQKVQRVLNLVDLVHTLLLIVKVHELELFLWKYCGVVLPKHKDALVVRSKILGWVVVVLWPLVKVKLVVKDIGTQQLAHLYTLD